MNTWKSSSTVKSFRPDCDTTSYLGNITAEKEKKIRDEINQQVRIEANLAIHKIVMEKDSKIERLRDAVEKKENIINLIQQELLLYKDKTKDNINENVIDQLATAAVTDNNAFISEIYNIIKRGTSSTEFNNVNQEKIRKIILLWKQFFEEYKWKSNHIAIKMKKLLKTTEELL